MKARRLEQYHKHGCNFAGKLVVVDYSEDAKGDPKFEKFRSQITLDYLDKARALVAERKYKVVKELLSIPELVVQIE